MASCACWGLIFRLVSGVELFPPLQARRGGPERKILRRPVKEKNRRSGKSNASLSFPIIRRPLANRDKRLDPPGFDRSTALGTTGRARLGQRLPAPRSSRAFEACRAQLRGPAAKTRSRIKGRKKARSCVFFCQKTYFTYGTNELASRLGAPGLQAHSRSPPSPPPRPARKRCRRMDSPCRWRSNGEIRNVSLVNGQLVPLTQPSLPKYW